MPIHGDGNQNVDPVNLKDVCDCIHRLLFSPDESWNQTYNVGSGRSISINELADVYVEAAVQMGLKALDKSYVEVPKRFRPYCLDVSKAREKLDWAPSTPIEEGVIELLQDYLKSHPCLRQKMVARAEGTFGHLP